MRFRPFLAALGASLCAGAALMVTLVNVELFGQGVLGKEQNEAVFLLLWFLGALPIGALLGGWLATRIGDRIVAFVGLLIAAVGYWLISHWTVDVLTAHHDLGFVHAAHVRHRPGGRRSGPRPGHRPADLGDAAGGPGRPARHRVGVGGGRPHDRHADRYRGAVSAWGLYRFNQHLAELPASTGGNSLAERLAAEAARVREAYVLQYGEIFTITAIVCVVGAVLGLLIAGRNEHAEEPDVVEAQQRSSSAAHQLRLVGAGRRRRRSVPARRRGYAPVMVSDRRG